MYQVKFQKPVSDPLPTMYDLPSEDPEEPGLPDEFHDFQPKLLRETCVPPTYPQNEIFIGADLNLYYDKNHTGWYKRPDWFLCLGVTSGTEQKDMRLSYVIWEETVSPFLVIELLSPGTEDEDLGQKVREIGKPPLKWEVYERILRVPYYVVYDRYVNEFRLFRLMPTKYQEMTLQNRRFWFEELQLGLGVWDGVYQGKNGQWLRWYDGAGEWIPTEAEARQTEQQARAVVEVQLAAEQQARIATESRQMAAEQQAQMEAETRRLAIPRLASMGLTAAQIAEALSLPVEDVERII
jgi:Uma2 family endonuclease